MVALINRSHLMSDVCKYKVAIVVVLLADMLTFLIQTFYDVATINGVRKCLIS